MHKVNALAISSTYSSNSYFANHTSVNLGLDENQSGYSFISTIMSPFICRLPEHESSYMSLRHVRDLKVIRPIIDFLIENHADIFAGLIPISNNQVPSNTSAGKSLMQYANAKSLENLSESTVHQPHVHAEALKLSAQTFPNIPQINIPVLESHAKASENAEAVSSSSISLQNVNLNSWEWKIFEALVSSTVSTYLLPCSQSTIPANQQLSPCTSFSYQIKRKSSIGDDDFDYINDISNSSAPSGCILFGNNWTNNEKYECTVANIKTKYNCEFSSNNLVRKQMVSECRKLRAQIIKFEDEWAATHSRTPKVMCICCDLFFPHLL